MALTYTLEDGYGAKAVVAGAGFLLNNEMGDFNLIPGRTDTVGPDRHARQPDRPAQADAQLDDADDRPARTARSRLVTGSPGGRTIPNTTLWVVLNVLEFGLEPRAAVDAPRTHHQWFPDVLLLEGDSWPDGHTVGPLGDGPHVAADRPPGQCQHDRRRPLHRPDPWHRRPSPLDHQGRRVIDGGTCRSQHRPLCLSC